MDERIVVGVDCSKCSIDSPACPPKGTWSAPIDRLTDEKSPVRETVTPGSVGAGGGCNSPGSATFGVPLMAGWRVIDAVRGRVVPVRA